MIPILYEATERSFTTNGLGRLSDAVECTITEERNGEYELFMKYPTNGAHYADLSLDRLIYAAPGEGRSNQAFRIYRVSKPLNGVVSVYAEHISYLLNKEIVEPFTASSVAQVMALMDTKIIGGTEFEFWTDKTVSASFKVEAPQSVRACLGGTQGSILDVYGTGEYEFDMFNVKLYLHRGQDSGAALRYGKNITDITADTDMSNVYTAIIPFWKNQDTVKLLPEKILYASTQYSNTLAKAVDFSSDFEDEPTDAQLRAKGQAYLTQNAGWVIKQNIKVDFIQLWQTSEYANYAPLQRVKLCDTVTVIYEPLDVTATAKVVKTVYNVLLDRYDSMEIGEASSNMNGAVAEVAGTVTENLPDVSMMEKAITHATDLITGGLGGYVVMKPNADGQPEEILILDNPDIDLAINVLRINRNGIGFSSNGYEGPFTSAWTLDGHFVADFITTGTLNANVIRAGILADAAGKNYWNMLTGEFSLSQEAASEIAGELSQTDVMKALTNNGQAVGIWLQNGQLYMNATYITAGQMAADRVRTGKLTAQNGVSQFNLNDGDLYVGWGSDSNPPSERARAHIRSLNGAYIVEHWNGYSWQETGSFYDNLDDAVSMLYCRRIYLDRNGGTYVHHIIETDGNGKMRIHSDNGIYLEGDLYSNNFQGVTGNYGGLRFEHGLCVGTA